MKAEVRFVTEPLATVEVSATVGPTVSITTLANAAPAAEVALPIVCVAAIDQVPSESVGKVQLCVVDVATNEQVTVPPPVLVAVKVTVAPTVMLEIVTFGVLSFVILSVAEEPVSEPAANAGVPGVARLAT